MDDLIGELWKQSPLCITREQFAKGLEGWTFDPVYKDGEMAAVVLVNGPEFHFSVFTKGLRCTKAHLAKYPGSLIERYGYATTRTPKDDTRQRRFNERCGFFVTGEDAFDIHYRIERLRPAKEN
jgi:hypothetical protein